MFVHFLFPHSTILICCCTTIGNNFGRDGIELLKESLEAKELLDALQSLSDDEGLTEDEDEEEGGAGEEEEGVAKGRPADETEGDVNTDEKLQVKGVAISPEKQSKGEGSSQPVSVARVLCLLVLDTLGVLMAVWFVPCLLYLLLLL